MRVSRRLRGQAGNTEPATMIAVMGGTSAGVLVAYPLIGPDTAHAQLLRAALALPVALIATMLILIVLLRVLDRRDRKVAPRLELDEMPGPEGLPVDADLIPTDVLGLLAVLPDGSERWLYAAPLEPASDGRRVLYRA